MNIKQKMRNSKMIVVIFIQKGFRFFNHHTFPSLKNQKCFVAFRKRCFSLWFVFVPHFPLCIHTKRTIYKKAQCTRLSPSLHTSH